MAETKRAADAEATRGQILDAAQRLFVDRGFAGTSISNIARDAGVTKSLIYHHFATKVELWARVKDRLLAEYTAGQRNILSADELTTDLLRAAMSAYFHFVQHRPDFVRLIALSCIDEAFLQDAEAKGETELWANEELLSVFVDRIRDAQLAGVVRSDVNPYMVLILVISTIQAWFQSRPWYLQQGRLEDSPTTDEMFLDTMLKVLMDGMRPQSIPETP